MSDGIRKKLKAIGPEPNSSSAGRSLDSAWHAACRLVPKRKPAADLRPTAG